MKKAGVSFEQNILNAYQQEGADWLQSLPELIVCLSQHWSLTELTPIENMSWNYVATAWQDQTPVVLKISFDKMALLAEYHALQHFAKSGAIAIIDFYGPYQALLLARALPGISLKNNFSAYTDAIPIYAEVIAKLTKLPSTVLTLHINDWLMAIDRITTTIIPKTLIDKAQTLRQYLLNTLTREYLCHGDLHLDNIILDKQSWVMIDPKGITAELAFEAAAFDLLNQQELEVTTQTPHLILERSTLLAQELDITQDRLLAWFFLRNILAAQWLIEDNSDPSPKLVLAQQVYALLG
jgi:streptomycin 6-kinase